MWHRNDVSLLRHGVVTVSLSEDGFERVYQSTALFPCLRFALAPGAIVQAFICVIAAAQELAQVGDKKAEKIGTDHGAT